MSKIDCNRNPCKSKKNQEDETQRKEVSWEEYPTPEDEDFGYGKMCYFISCPVSALPIRDYKYEKKIEPHYEDKTYNVCASCNKRGIQRAYERGISYIIFYTRYRGKQERYKDRYFITGLFSISAQAVVPCSDDGTRMAYRSDDPIFLSIKDSLELTDERWQKWFGEPLPSDKHGNHNLRWMPKFVKKHSTALQDILNHFETHNEDNKIKAYVREIRKYKSTQ